MSVSWRTIREFTDILYERADGEGIAKITINRPEVRNAFRPQTVTEMIAAFDEAREDPEISSSSSTVPSRTTSSGTTTGSSGCTKRPSMAA